MSAARKYIIIPLVLTGVVITALAALGIWRYQRDLKNDTPIEKLGAAVITPDQARLGEPLTVTADFKCPWHRHPTEAIIAPVKGLVQAGSPEIRRIKTRFGYNIWQIRATLKAYHTGELNGSTMQVIFNRNGENPRITEISQPLPQVKISELASVGDAAKLDLAGTLEKEMPLHQKLMYVAIALAILLLAVLIIREWLKRRNRRKNAPIPPWQSALQELLLLRHLLKTGNSDKPSCFVRLNDIVRNYLEKRFQLKAPHQTTEEFMRDLNRGGSPLQEHQRRFLGEFMTASDLVKFANMPPDELLLDQAIDKAETLVTETRPQTEEDKK